MSTHVKIDPTTSKRSRATRQLEILALRCLELADRVAASEIAFSTPSTWPMRSPPGPAWSKRSATTSCTRPWPPPSLMRGGRD